MKNQNNEYMTLKEIVLAIIFFVLLIALAFLGFAL
jgi:preprotein translocase subunit SecG|tara:strand:+ start:926 stop:1030 length:105 start_codon:yes stop_codon:yes gene_type:complete